MVVMETYVAQKHVRLCLHNSIVLVQFLWYVTPHTHIQVLVLIIHIKSELLIPDWVLSKIHRGPLYTVT